MINAFANPNASFSSIIRAEFLNEASEAKLLKMDLAPLLDAVLTRKCQEGNSCKHLYKVVSACLFCVISMTFHFYITS
jgi:hypothetical protein